MSKTIKVLMVDDEEQFRSTTRKIMDKKGFDTILAADGPEAIERLEAAPDVIILDIKMPGMDGHAVLAEIRRREPATPVIMLTGHGALPSAQRALAEGAYDYLTKPCDVDVLALKIIEASESRGRSEAEEEVRVMGAMVPLQEYTVINGAKSLREAAAALRESFTARMATSRLLETGHRSILVTDDGGEVIGLLAITDLLALIMPAYLSLPKPSTADSIQYSPMFWRGMFRKEVKAKADMPVKDVMSPAPLTIDGKASLMEAAFAMHSNRARRLLVMLSGQVAGIIREQDLFFEMDRFLKE